MSSKPNHLIVANEGRTLVYIIPAVLCAVAAIPLLFFFFPLAIVFIALTVFLSLVETGLEFNSETNSYRKFKSLFGSKWGEWKRLVDPIEFHLKLSIEREYSNNAFSSVGSTNWNGSSTEIARSVTYDFIYESNTVQHKIIYEFLDYDIAKRFLKEIHLNTSIPVTNHIAIKLQENREKRMNRR